METPDAALNNSLRSPGYVSQDPTILQELWGSFITMDAFDSITNQMLLMEAYENAYGISPKDNASPITLVTKNASTELYSDSLYERTMSKFIKYRIAEATGLNLIEFLNQPTYKVAMIMRALRTVRKNESINPAVLELLKQEAKLNKTKLKRFNYGKSRCNTGIK